MTSADPALCAPAARALALLAESIQSFFRSVKWTIRKAVRRSVPPDEPKQPPDGRSPASQPSLTARPCSSRFLDAGDLLKSRQLRLRYPWWSPSVVVGSVGRSANHAWNPNQQ